MQAYREASKRARQGVAPGEMTNRTPRKCAQYLPRRVWTSNSTDRPARGTSCAARELSLSKPVHLAAWDRRELSWLQWLDPRSNYERINAPLQTVRRHISAKGLRSQLLFASIP